MPIPYEQYTVHTPDGFALTLYRSRPPARPLRPRPPVLLIPGFCSNRFTFGVRADASLPTLLNGAGRDVWIAELRGARSSRWLGKGRAVVDVDAKLALDLPAVITHIRAHTDLAKVDVIGHSLGGLLALLAAGKDGHGIGRIVTLATPGNFKGIVGPFEASGPLFRGLARGVERVVGNLGGFGLPGLAKTPGPLPHLFLQGHFLPGACTAAVRRLYLDHAIEPLHGGELAQITRWVREGVLTDRDGRSYEPLLANVRVPVLLVAATRDGVSPEANTYAAYAKVGSADKTFRLVGRAHGARRDYAHACLLLAESARRDVHEPLIDWLESRATRDERVSISAGPRPKSAVR